jgi:hypothetical protein
VINAARRVLAQFLGDCNSDDLCGGCALCIMGVLVCLHSPELSGQGAPKILLGLQNKGT